MNEAFIKLIYHRYGDFKRSKIISVNQYLRHNLGYKQKIIQVIRRNQVYFSSSNVLTDTTVIVKDA